MYAYFHSWSGDMKATVKKLYRYIEGINGLLLILYSVFVFSTSVITSSYFSKYYFIISELIIIVLSIIICPKILKLFSKVSIRQHAHEIKNNEKRYITSLRLAFYLISFFILLIYYIAYYPGGFSTDSINQYTQTVTNQYNDWHPVIQTLFAFKLPLILTGGWIGSIALFQIICFSMVLGYSFNAIYQYTDLKYTILSMAFVLLNPQLGYISVYPWKDVSFAIGAILLLTYSLKIYITKGCWIKSPLNMSLFIVTTSLTTLFRHNALLFTGPLVFAILFYLTRKRGMIICLSIIMLCLGIKYPMYYAMGVENPAQRQVETLGLPMTVIGAAITYTPEALDDETRAFAYKVAPKEVWKATYRYGSYNGVKWDHRTNNDVIEEYGTQKVISMMLKCFKYTKKVSLISLIKLTRAAYTVSDPYNVLLLPKIRENNLGIEQKGNERIQGILNGYSSFATSAFPHLFMYLGVMHLLLIVSILSKCRLNKMRDWNKIFFVIPVFTYNFGTTVLLTGVDDAPRFFFYTFLLIPTLLVFLYRKDNERGLDESVLLLK